MSNFNKYFGTPEKLSYCIIEPDILKELDNGSEDCLKVYTNYDGDVVELGYFAGAWEFEEWLYSDLPYDEWRKQNPISVQTSH